MVTSIPTSVAQLTIVSIVLDDLISSHFETCMVSHSTGIIENALGILASERRVAIISRYWRPHLGVDSYILSLL